MSKYTLVDGTVILRHNGPVTDEEIVSTLNRLDAELESLTTENTRLTDSLEEMQKTLQWKLGVQRKAEELVQSLTAEVSRLNEQPRITPTMAQMILDAAEAHIEGDYEEVYHQIRIFAHELTDDPYDSWKAIKTTASGREERTGFERECDRCGKEYGGLGVPLCPECFSGDEKVQSHE